MAEHRMESFFMWLLLDEEKCDTLTKEHDVQISSKSRQFMTEHDLKGQPGQEKFKPNLDYDYVQAIMRKR